MRRAARTIGECFRNACERGSFRIVPFYRWDREKDDYDYDHGSFMPAFPADDGMHGVANGIQFEDREMAQAVVDSLNAAGSAEKAEEYIRMLKEKGYQDPTSRFLAEIAEADSITDMLGPGRKPVPKEVSDTIDEWGDGTPDMTADEILDMAARGKITKERRDEMLRRFQAGSLAFSQGLVRF